MPASQNPRRTAQGAEYAAHCIELLAPLGPVEARRMFGGRGLYVGEVMVGLIAGERLYLKTDMLTRAQWQAADGRPFVYARRRGEVAETETSYWTPPDEAMESPALMLPWGRLALEAALRARTARSVRRRRSAARE
jgi:DNA transformation protein